MAQRPNILLITTDQQRFDSIGCFGNEIVATPTLDRLAATGFRYSRTQPQTALCTPSRATILTGQHPGTHGVWCNGVSLPPDAPSVAQLLRDNGYRTCHIGKLHFEPTATFSSETQPEDWNGPYRGFEHVETVDHVRKNGHYGRWLLKQLGKDKFEAQVEETRAAWSNGRGGDTGAPETVYSSLPPEVHPSRWAVERLLAWLDETGSGGEAPWFGWLSFDDPHHPFNPPVSYGRRYQWREIPLPASYPEDESALERDLGAKPWQYKAWHDGRLRVHEGTNGDDLAWVGPDQIREMTALTYAMVDLIDDSLRELMEGLQARGLTDNTHIIFTTDHGELLGDHGLIFKGPFHLDGTLRIPLIWSRPDASGGGKEITDPVGLVDLAPTIAGIAGLQPPDWMDGEPLPTRDGTRQRVITMYDSYYWPDLQLRSMHRDGFTITAYPKLGHEVGELYDHKIDPLQQENLWSVPSKKATRDDLLDDLVNNVKEFPEDRLPWHQHA